MTLGQSLTLFSNIAKSLVIKLLKPRDEYNLRTVIQFYPSFTNTEDFCRSNDSNEKFMKIMKEFESSRVVGIDKISRGFLKDLVEGLPKLV